jgi:hypothetical protein
MSRAVHATKSGGGGTPSNAPLERHLSIDAQLRLLVPGKVSDDDKLIEYDALLVDRFLDILQDSHGHKLRELVLIILSFSIGAIKKTEVLAEFYGFVVSYAC